MAIWNFNVTHKDQTTATGSKDVSAQGNGQSVTINNVPCSCGFNHTLIGTQITSTRMSGSGNNSVAPPNDPNSQGNPKDDDVPSWEGGPGNVDEDKGYGDKGDSDDKGNESN